MRKQQQGESKALSQTPMMTYAESRRYAVVVPKYSHEGSAFTRDHSFHATEGAATAQADSLRASQLYRFVEVEDRAPLTAHQPDANKTPMIRVTVPATAREGR